MMHVGQTIIIALLVILSATLCLPSPVYAHGAKIAYSSNVTIETVATYDSGEPMSGAQVVVYAPDNPATPWLKGTTDKDGHFAFTPDISKPGTWDVQIRQAGHGDMIHIPIGENTAAAGDTSGFTPLQIIVMAVCVGWGLVGTALYFHKGKA